MFTFPLYLQLPKFSVDMSQLTCTMYLSLPSADAFSNGDCAELVLYTYMNESSRSCAKQKFLEFYNVVLQYMLAQSS